MNRQGFPRRRLRRTALLGALAIAVPAIAACGSSSSGAVSAPVIGAAKTFSLAGFEPATKVVPGKPTTVSFTIQQPNGKPLTAYKTGSGPHTGVHLIIVRDDLAYIIHQHPPVGANGLLRQTVTFPAPGRYRVLVDAYPNIPGGQPNFQLFQDRRRQGRVSPQGAAAVHLRSDRRRLPHRHAGPSEDPCDPGAVRPRRRDRSATGKQVTFVPWFGALAHAIFFHEGSLDYFHTHICAPNAPNCGALPGVTSSRVAGTSTAPGKLTIGVLLPAPGTWRLFLQMKLGGRVVTAPYTLKVAS